MNKISIIVPIYNVEKYLNRCVNSIVEQTYKNLEIILVDDGSPDNCPKMCDDWAEKDNRIRVIHKPNGGLSDARNAGVEIATGDYIGFIDSDDYISQNMYQILLEAMLENDGDISLCGYMFVDETGRDITKIECPIEDEVLDKREVLSKLNLTEGLYYTTAWNRLYKAEIAKKIKFPFGKIHEDEFTAHRFYGECKKVVCCKEKLYYYIQRENSITTGKVSLKRLDCFEALLDRYNYFKENKYDELLRGAIYKNWHLLYDFMLKINVSKNAKEVFKRIFKLSKIIIKYDFFESINLYIVFAKRYVKGIILRIKAK